jgi:hypothetical protein
MSLIGVEIPEQSSAARYRGPFDVFDEACQA